MKKIKFITMVLVCVLLMTSGCGKDAKKAKENILECTSSETQGVLTIELKYTITYQGDYVQKEVSVNKITATKDVDLNAYKNTIEAEYEPYKDIKYYDNKIKIEKNTITSTRTIDYSKIDTDKLLSTGSEYYELITDGKVKLSTLKDLYTNIGMTCKKK